MPFTGSLTNNQFTQTSIGPCIVSSTRLRSGLSLLLFGSAIDQDHIFGSEWLLKQLNRLGYYLSYEDVQHSDLNNKSPEDFLAIARNGTFSQCSDENVDHDVRPLGQKGTSCHRNDSVNNGGNTKAMRKERKQFHQSSFET